MRLIFISFLAILVLPGLANNVYAYTGHTVLTKQKELQPLPIEGKWRGEFEIRPGLKVPFVFEFAKGSNNKPAIYFLNGDERFEGGFVKQVNDSVIVSLDQFDNEFALKLVGDELSGELRKQNGNTP